MLNSRQHSREQVRATSLSLILILIVVVNPLETSQDVFDSSSTTISPATVSHVPLNLTNHQDDKNCIYDTCYTSFHQDFENGMAGDMRNLPNESIKWHWKYVNEQSNQFLDLEHPERSVDERLANIQFAVSSIPMSVSDIYEFDLNPETDKRLEILAAKTTLGQVELCWQQLSSMLSLIDELHDFVEERRGSNLSQIVERKLEEKHLRLAHVLDSFGKYGPGLMAGRMMFLGSYTQCENSHLVNLDASGADKTEMRYCVAKLKADKHLHPDLRKLPRTLYQPLNAISTAICIPKSCHTKSFRGHKKLFQQLVDSQFKLPKSIYIDENLELDSVFCLIDKDSSLAQIPISGYLLIVILMVWFFLVAYASLSHSVESVNGRKPGKILNICKKRIINSLGLQSSWSDFIAENGRIISSSARVNLDTLNLFKVLGCMFVVFGHSIIVSVASCMNKLRAFYELENDPQAVVAMALTVVVDSFFVITGIIFAFIALKKIKRPDASGSYLSWFAKESVKLAGARYLRLVPLYFLMFWFKKSIIIYLGSGPTWDYGYTKKTVTGFCRLESWLTPFTAMSAFISLSQQCVPQVWSVALDIIYAVTLAPLLVFMSIKPKVTAIIAILLCLASNTSMRAAYSNLEPALKVDLADLRMHAFSQMFGDLTLLYSSPYFRVSSTLIGILAGCALYHYEQNKRLADWPSWFKGPLTKFAFLTMLSTITVPALIPGARYDFLVKYPIHHGVFEHLMSTSRLLWALSSAVLFLRMVTDWKNSFIMQNSASKFWKTMVRLNYPILLIHFDVLLMDLMNQTTVRMYSKYQVWIMFTSAYLTCCFISTLIHIFIENPIDKLVKSIWKNSSTHSMIKDNEKFKET